MNKDKVFQYLAFYVPSADESKEGKTPSIIVDLKTVIAPDDKSVIVIAARELPAEYVSKLERVQIVVRPF